MQISTVKGLSISLRRERSTFGPVFIVLFPGNTAFPWIGFHLYHPIINQTIQLRLLDFFFQVAELPPVTDEQFREKVLAYKSQTEAQAKEDDSSLYCTCCKKKLKSKAAFENHVASKKHKEMENQDPLERKGPKNPRKVVII